MPSLNMDDLVSLAKRRGFIFQSAALYGGMQGLYDFGPMGIELKKHLKDTWWRDMVYRRSDVEGLDSSILSHKMVFHYSGHEDTFSDPMVDCRGCKMRWRADHITTFCPNCKSQDLTDMRPFNLMFSTSLGPVADASAMAYLRPETAQGIFANFKHVVDATSRTAPFGIAQIGKSFRNEITPRNFIFRVREFEQMELEFFVKPGEDEMWHEYWVTERYNWWIKQGLDQSRLQKHYQDPKDLSHYSKATVDLLYAFPHGLEELEGIANRTDYDLASHTKDQASATISAKVKQNKDSTHKLFLRDLESSSWYIPYVIEPSAGVERGLLAILSESYAVNDVCERIVLKLKPHLAPVKACVIPLARNKPELVELANKVFENLVKVMPGRVMFENSGNIGKSYRKNDEIGTPCCITIDFDSIDNNSVFHNTVTVRSRDTTIQTRVELDNLIKYLFDNYNYFN